MDSTLVQGIAPKTDSNNVSGETCEAGGDGRVFDAQIQSYTAEHTSGEITKKVTNLEAHAKEGDDDQAGEAKDSNSQEEATKQEVDSKFSSLMKQLPNKLLGASFTNANDLLAVSLRELDRDASNRSLQQTRKVTIAAFETHQEESHHPLHLAVLASRQGSIHSQTSTFKTAVKDDKRNHDPLKESQTLDESTLSELDMTISVHNSSKFQQEQEDKNAKEKLKFLSPLNKTEQEKADDKIKEKAKMGSEIQKKAKLERAIEDQRAKERSKRNGSSGAVPGAFSVINKGPNAAGNAKKASERANEDRRTKERSKRPGNTGAVPGAFSVSNTGRSETENRKSGKDPHFGAVKPGVVSVTNAAPPQAPASDQATSLNTTDSALDNTTFESQTRPAVSKREQDEEDALAAAIAASVGEAAAIEQEELAEELAEQQRIREREQREAGKRAFSNQHNQAAMRTHNAVVIAATDPFASNDRSAESTPEHSTETATAAATEERQDATNVSNLVSAAPPTFEHPETVMEAQVEHAPEGYHQASVEEGVPLNKQDRNEKRRNFLGRFMRVKETSTRDIDRGDEENDPIKVVELFRGACLCHQRICIILTVISLLVVIIVAIAVPLSNRPPGDDPARLQSITNAVSSSSVSSEAALETAGSPQNSALQWLAYSDPAQVQSTDTNRILRRYVLAVIYYSLGGNSWQNQFFFLSGDHECRWHDVWDNGQSMFAGVTCNDENEILFLDFCK
jgi:hypothetical protein